MSEKINPFELLDKAAEMEEILMMIEKEKMEDGQSWWNNSLVSKIWWSIDRISEFSSSDAGQHLSNLVYEVKTHEYAKFHLDVLYSKTLEDKGPYREVDTRVGQMCNALREKDEWDAKIHSLEYPEIDSPMRRFFRKLNPIHRRNVAKLNEELEGCINRIDQMNRDTDKEAKQELGSNFGEAFSRISMHFKSYHPIERPEQGLERLAREFMEADPTASTNLLTFIREDVGPQKEKIDRDIEDKKQEQSTIISEAGLENSAVKDLLLRGYDFSDLSKTIRSTL